MTQTHKVTTTSKGEDESLHDSIFFQLGTNTNVTSRQTITGFRRTTPDRIILLDSKCSHTADDRDPLLLHCGDGKSRGQQTDLPCQCPTGITSAYMLMMSPVAISSSYNIEPIHMHRFQSKEFRIRYSSPHSSRC